MEAERWLLGAREDVRIAEACLGLGDPSLTGAACHLRQAAEKGIKGLLTGLMVPFRRTHDLVELGSLALPHMAPWADLLARLAPLTIWNTAYRYPSIETFPEVPPSDTALQTALADISNLLNRLHDLFEAHE